MNNRSFVSYLLTRTNISRYISIFFVSVLYAPTATSSSHVDEHVKPHKGTTINVLAQTRSGFVIVDKLLPEFKARTGINVNITYMREQERRRESRLDAAIEQGAYQVYHIDIENLQEFAYQGWILPLLEHYPDSYNYTDFDDYLDPALSYKGVVYAAPFMVSGDMIFYRKDILQAHHLSVPKNLEEMMHVIKTTHNPPETYGWEMREQAGAGMNVWRWAAYFKAFGGVWIENNTLIFNSEAGVKATKYLLDLHKYTQPVDPNLKDFFYVIEAFRGGKTPIIIDAFNFKTRVEKSTLIKGKWALAPALEDLPSPMYCDSFAIAKGGTKDPKKLKAAAEFIAWVTSTEVQTALMKDGQVDYISRQSVRNDPYYTNTFSDDFRNAVKKTTNSSVLTVWSHPLWHQVGDHLGVILEQLYSGDRKDIQGSLNEATEFGNLLLLNANLKLNESSQISKGSQ